MGMWEGSREPSNTSARKSALSKACMNSSARVDDWKRSGKRYEDPAMEGVSTEDMAELGRSDVPGVVA